MHKTQGTLSFLRDCAGRFSGIIAENHVLHGALSSAPADTTDDQTKDGPMAAFDTTRTAYGSTPAVTRILGFFGAFFAAVEDWQDSRATRKALSDLTDLELQDIGLIRGDIDLVAQNHFVR
jgi:uncharacterized protein YjiS (DUF1127 family)